LPMDPDPDSESGSGFRIRIHKVIEWCAIVQVPYFRVWKF
jgi:hypothetical protein